MSYKLFGGVHDILSNVNELKSLGPNQREKGQIIAVKDGDYRVYIWDPTATAKGLLCSLSNEDPVSTMWPSKASTWYPQTTPSVFEERAHMLEEDGVRTDYSGNILRDDFSYLFVVPDDISGGVASSTDYTNIEGRWVAMNYASLVDGIPWDTRSGHILPRYNDTFDFGNAEHKVRDFYLSSSTIWMGEDHKISIDGSGQLKFLKRKKGKLPEYIMANAITAHGSEAAATRVLLQAIKDSTEITSPHVNAIDNITNSTVVPPGMNLSLRDWIRLAIATGFNNPIPDGIFGESDFEDAISLHSHSDSDGDDGSTGGPYADLGDLLGRLDILEDYFDGGFLDKEFVDPQILRDEALDSYLAAKFAEHISGETDIVRDSDFGVKWNERWFELPEWLRADDLIINWPDIVNPPDFVLDTEFDTRWDTRLGTIEPGDIAGLHDYISANPDVLLGAGARGFFDDAGMLKQAHGDWIASNDYVDGLGPVIIPAGSVDLTQYARVSDLNEVLLNKLNISDVDSYIPDMTSINTVVSYFVDGKLDASFINGLLDTSNVPDMPYGSITGLADLLEGKLNVADLPPYDEFIDSSIMESFVGNAIAALNLGPFASKPSLGLDDILNLGTRLGNLQAGIDGKLDVNAALGIDRITGLQGILDGKLGSVAIGDIPGLQGALDNKLESVGIGDISGLQGILDGKLEPGDTIAAGDIAGTLDVGVIPGTIARSSELPTGIPSDFSIYALQTGLDAVVADVGTLNGRFTASGILSSNHLPSTVISSQGHGNTTKINDVALGTTNGVASQADLLHVESGFLDFAVDAYRAVEWNSYTKLDGSSPAAHIRHFGNAGGNITDWVDGKLSTGFTDFVDNDLTGHINANTEVQKGVTARGFFDGSSNLKMANQTHSMFGNDGKFRGTLHENAMLADGTTAINTKINSFSTNFNTVFDDIEGLADASDFGVTDYSAMTQVLVTMSAGGSDKDLKDIIREVPANEITTDYHLIGLTTVEYEWKPIAKELFGYSGHVAEGFISEQLEQLFPATDPENPPTSKEDGHIWWYNYTTSEQKTYSPDAHDYYTFFNSEMLQEKIDAAKAALSSD